MKDGDKLLVLAKRRDQLHLLWTLLSSPAYTPPWWYWLDYFKPNQN